MCFAVSSWGHRASSPVSVSGLFSRRIFTLVSKSSRMAYMPTVPMCPEESRSRVDPKTERIGVLERRIDEVLGKGDSR